MEIHLLLSGIQLGPFTEEQLRQYLAEGLATSSDLALLEGSDAWEPVHEVLAKLPPPAPPPEPESEPSQETDPVFSMPTEEPVASESALLFEQNPNAVVEPDAEPISLATGEEPVALEPESVLPSEPEPVAEPEPESVLPAPDEEAVVPEQGSATLPEPEPVAAGPQELELLPLAPEAVSPLPRPVPAPPPVDPFNTLTSTQRTRRKHGKPGKIIIQPILPMEITPSLSPRKKERTGRTALTLQLTPAMDAPAPATDSAQPVVDVPAPAAEEPVSTLPTLPVVTSVLREMKPVRAITLPNRIVVRKDQPEKIPAPVPEAPTAKAPAALPMSPVTAAPAAPAPAEMAIPFAPAKMVDAPPSKKSFKRKRSSKKPVIPPLAPAAFYACAGLSVLIIILIAVSYLKGSTQQQISQAGTPAMPENVPALPPLATNSDQPLIPENTPQTADEYTSRGDLKQTQGNLDGAIADYTQALLLDPKNVPACVQALCQRAQARQAKGDTKGALADYTQALGLNPHYANAYSSRGYLKQAAGDLDGAIADYTQALLIDPKIPEAYYKRGLIKVQRGDLDGAAVDFNHALSLDPKMADAYYNRGNIKNTEGNVDGAIADYTQALTLDPKIALAYCNRGFARQSKDDIDGALADYTQALALKPDMAVAYYNRGLIKEQTDNLDGAITDTAKAIELDPKNAQAYCNLGLAMLGKGDLDGALTNLKKFCEMAPRDGDADYARLYIWLISTQQNPRGRADVELSNALENEWNSTPEDLVSKIAAFLLGHMNEADLIANAATPDLSLDPGQHCKAWYFAGMKRLLAGDMNGAIDALHKCVATGQKNYCEYIFAQTELRALGQGK